ncbi:hypothetical protein CORC01_14176, partial [Colletotrichum orchidophilum]
FQGPTSQTDTREALPCPGRYPKSERLPDLYASGWHTPIAFADGRRLQFQESILSKGPSAGRRRGGSFWDLGRQTWVWKIMDERCGRHTLVSGGKREERLPKWEGQAGLMATCQFSSRGSTSGKS